MIYLDNSATSPIDEEVRDAMLPYLSEEFGNPSSKYYCKATNAKNAVEDAREKVAKLLGAEPGEIIFTAGVQLVGAYGKSTSENYGEVSLVLKVKMIANKNEISIGGNSNWPVMLIDEEGNVSEPRYLGWTPYSVSEGIYMKIILKDSSTFTNVKKSAKIIQKAQIALSLSYDEKGLLIMKNVPIQWDVQP